MNDLSHVNSPLEAPSGASFLPPETCQTDHQNHPFTDKFPGLDEVAVLLEEEAGNVLRTARRLGVSRNTLKSWMAYFEEAGCSCLIEARQRGREGLRDTLQDTAEAGLIYLMEGVTIQQMTRKGPVIFDMPPSLDAIKYYFDNQGKFRGNGLTPNSPGDGDEEIPDAQDEAQDEDDTGHTFPDNGTASEAEAPLPESWSTIAGGQQPS